MNTARKRKVRYEKRRKKKRGNAPRKKSAAANNDNKKAAAAKRRLFLCGKIGAAARLTRNASQTAKIGTGFLAGSHF